MQNESPDFFESSTSVLKQYDECPECFLDEDRWIYRCDTCGFVGCYNDIEDEGCYQGSPDVRQCPECDGEERTLIGKVDMGSSEEI